MSSSLNALGATLFEDFVRPCLRNKISDKTVNNIIKCVVVIIGALCVLIVFVVDKLGAVLQVEVTKLYVVSCEREQS
jgi:insulin-like growth factor 2 mRNA-binding protein 1